MAGTGGLLFDAPDQRAEARGVGASRRKSESPMNGLDVWGYTPYPFRYIGTGAFLPRDSASKNFDLGKEGV